MYSQGFQRIVLGTVKEGFAIVFVYRLMPDLWGHIFIWKEWWHFSPKNNVRCFMWMKATNLNSAWWLNYWRCDDSIMPKNLFMMCFCIWCVLLLCRLWRRELGELYYVMECNPNCSMKIFHEFCESRFYKEIGGKIFWEWKDEVMRSIFDAG